MNLKYYKNIISLILLFAAFVGCDEKEIIDPYVSKLDTNAISIVNLNPNTGEEYTLEELGLLTYDASRENYFDSTQIIQLYLHVSEEAQKVDVIRANGEIFKTTTDFEETEEGLKKAKFQFTVLDLGLDIFKQTHLTFQVTYKENEELRTGSIVYTIYHIEKFIPPQFDSPVLLIKNSGDTIVLPVQALWSIMSDGGQYGTVISYSKDNYATIQSSNDLNFRHEGDFSVGIWINTNLTQGNSVIIGDKDWESDSNPGFLFSQIGSNWKLNAGDGTNIVDIEGSDINDGQWHFLTATFDRDGVATIFTDGVKNGSKDMSAFGNMNANLAFNLGQDGTGDFKTWEGKTGSVYIFDYVLTEMDVMLFGATGVQLKKKNGEQAMLQVTNNSSSVSIEEERLTYTFDGVDDFVTINPVPELDFRYENDYSISFWVNTTSTDSDPVMIGDQNWNSAGNDGLSIAFRGTNWRVAYADGQGHKADARTSGIPFNDGEWHLLTTTFDRDGDLKMYQDGVEVKSTNMTAVTNSESGNPLRLAQDGTGLYGQFFEGKISDTFIYDYVLTPEEILEYYNQ